MMLQLKVPCEIKPNKADGEIAVFEFSLGPVHISCIANIPKDGAKSSAYVKISLDNGNMWEEWSK